MSRSTEGPTKLSRPRTILCHTRPIIRPRLVTMCTETDHWLNREAHSRLRFTNSLVLRVMWNVRRAVEQLIDAMSAVCLDDAAAAALCMLLYRVTEVAKQHAGLHHRNGVVQAFSRGFYHAHRVGVCQRFAAHIIRFVEIAMESAVV